MQTLLNARVLELGANFVLGGPAADDQEMCTFLAGSETTDCLGQELEILFRRQTADIPYDYGVRGNAVSLTEPSAVAAGELRYVNARRDNLDPRFHVAVAKHLRHASAGRDDGIAQIRVAGGK